ncbi:hypothetical protein PFAG_05065 [Plasmodium falciparum Santa Lucia]|uniref:Glycophorin-binding protein n=1 Tax=Plasmodium falciparum Santa Lucia TaxID=478859 RepID=W7FYI9_PLAFA|nr:hypothetical protein PFAG_05065 [Plasmodium falciparum Santa Lucia]
MRISKASNIESTGVSNCKNFNSKNCSKYSLMEVQNKNEKKRSLTSFHAKNITLIFGIIYVALLGVYICASQYKQAADYSFRESRVLAEGKSTKTSADPEGQIMKAYAADPEYRKHVNVLYQILNNTDPNDESS